MKKQSEQERLLTAAVQRLAQPARIEVLSKAMAVSRFTHAVKGA